MKKISILHVCFCSILLATCQIGSADIITTNNRSAFISSLDTTFINEDLEGFAGSDVDFDNSSVNLPGFTVSQSGDEFTTQFINGTFTNSGETGNPGVDIQFIVDVIGPDIFNSGTSNQADSSVIAVTLGGVNSFGFDTFGFNDQGLSLLQNPQALGLELGVLTTVVDTLGNSQSFVVDPTDTFFGVTSTHADIATITFTAEPLFATQGGEFFAVDNFVGGSSSIPEPTSVGILLATGLGCLLRRRYR